MPNPVSTQLSYLDLADLAQAAVKVFQDDNLVFGTYELVGTQPLSQFQIAAMLSGRLNILVQAVEIPLSDWKSAALKQNMSAYAFSSLTSMFAYYAQFGLPGSPQTLTWLLNRTPTNLNDFISREF